MDNKKINGLIKEHKEIETNIGNLYSKLKKCESKINKCFKIGDYVRVIEPQSCLCGAIGVIVSKPESNGFQVGKFKEFHGSPSFDWTWVEYIKNDG